MTAPLLFALLACSGGEPAPAPAPAPAPEPAEPAPPAKPTGPLPGILMVQAWFGRDSQGKIETKPAKMVLWQTNGTQWFDETILDKDSNVFHKAMFWGDGILTIGAEDAKLKHWTRQGNGWTAETLWTQSWGGKFDRLRDIEIADLDGDGQDEFAIATHDQGVVAVGDKQVDGTWTFFEYDKTPDIFVHEIEIGDVDGDGKLEFYATPSERNKSSGVSQPGGVTRYDYDGNGGYTSTKVVWWDESHAKEILVADLDANGTDELYVVKEGHVEKEGGRKVIKDPVKIVRMVPGPKGKKFKAEPVATIDGEPQTRFLSAGDVDGDGQIELVAAGMQTGLWVLQPPAEGEKLFTPELIDKKSGGFEHATHLADLDKDGKLEIYVASDKQKQFRRYTWDGSSWQREKIADIPDQHITWNLQDAVF